MADRDFSGGLFEIPPRPLPSTTSTTTTTNVTSLDEITKKPPFVPYPLSTLSDFEKAFALLDSPPHFPTLIRKAEENATSDKDRRVLKDALNKAVEVGSAPAEVLPIIDGLCAEECNRLS